MSLLRKLRGYRKEIARLQKTSPGSVRRMSLARDFFAWKQSLRNKVSPIDDRRPWLTFSATRFLHRRLNKKMRVFEWGSGGSTLFFATRVGEVVTIENDREWADRVTATLKAEGLTNVQMELIGPDPENAIQGGDPANPAHHISASALFGGRTFLQYASRIDGFPDHYFDVVLVDGRVRPSCVRHAIPKVAPGGFIVLDNAERPHYQAVKAELEPVNWRMFDRSGPGPCLSHFWQTQIWQKRC